jgi:hypothetical protein
MDPVDYGWLDLSRVLYCGPCHPSCALQTTFQAVSSMYMFDFVFIGSTMLGGDLVMEYEMNQRFGSQSELVTMWCDLEVLVLATRSSSGVQLASECWFQVVYEMSQSLALVGLPTKISNICRIIIRHSTLATKPLLSFYFIDCQVWSLDLEVICGGVFWFVYIVLNFYSLGLHNWIALAGLQWSINNTWIFHDLVKAIKKYMYIYPLVRRGMFSQLCSLSSVKM